MRSDLVERLQARAILTEVFTIKGPSPEDNAAIMREAACEIERLQDRQFAGDGEPFILSGKDMTQHWVEGGSTDLMRGIAKHLEETHGRDAGSPSVVLENLADDFDLMAEHAVQLRATVKQLESELAHQRRQRASALRYGCEMQKLTLAFVNGDDLTPHRERCPLHTAMLEVYRAKQDAVSF